jgi:signal transduction histidine kinase
MKTNILLKRTVILSLVGFSILFSAGITLIFRSSIKRDTEHIRFVSLSGNVESEILKARILIDDIILNKDDAYLQDFERSIDTVRQGLDELHALFTEESRRNKELDIDAFREFYASTGHNLKQIENRLNQSPDFSVADTILLNALSGFIVDYRNLHSFLPKYLIQDNIRYKREIIIVLVINFMIILLAGFFIVKLIDQLIRADRTLVVKTIEVENRERERIAADLHDGLGAMLSGLIIHIRVLEKQNRENPELLNQLNHLNYMSNEALKSIEEVIHNLNPSALTRYGLIRSLEKYTEKVNVLGKTQFSVHADNFDCQLGPSTESLLYRICSELINNALKHSSAAHATFTVYNRKKQVHLEYADDGVGFDLEEAIQETEKSGLSNLVKRVDSLEGSYLIESKPGKGVRVSIMFKES